MTVFKTALVLFLLATTLPAADLPQVVARHISSLYTSKAGVDASDHLWVWNRQSNTVTRFASNGASTISRGLPPSAAIDADALRGIATLSRNGMVVQVLSWEGRVAHRVSLLESAHDIAWLVGPLVAVTPRLAAHRLEVWNVATGKRVRTMGACLPISQEPGEHLLRTTLVRYDGLRDEVVALDATFGTVYRFDATARPLGEVRLPTTPTPVHEFLVGAPSPAGGRAVSNFGLTRYSSLSIAEDGVLWIREGGSPRDRVRMFQIGRDGTTKRVEVRVPTSRRQRVQVWGDRVIVFGDPTAGGSPTTAVFGAHDVRAVDDEASAPQNEAVIHQQPRAPRGPVRVLEDASACKPWDVMGCCADRWCDDPVTCKCPSAPPGTHIDPEGTTCLCDYEGACTRICDYDLG